LAAAPRVGGGRAGLAGPGAGPLGRAAEGVQGPRRTGGCAMTGSADTMVSSEVEVAVDPDAAFTAFTEELDLWWVRGPINHFAGGRTLALRCEPGGGGPLLAGYEGDALGLGRVTAWGPGQRP